MSNLPPGCTDRDVEEAYPEKPMNKTKCPKCGRSVEVTRGRLNSHGWMDIMGGARFTACKGSGLLVANAGDDKNKEKK